MDDEEWTAGERLKVHLIVINSDVQTQSPRIGIN
jgi:hypothetical protein